MRLFRAPHELRFPKVRLPEIRCHATSAYFSRYYKGFNFCVNYGRYLLPWYIILLVLSTFLLPMEDKNYPFDNDGIANNPTL